MEDKKQILTMLKDEFNRWENLLSGLTEEQITTSQLPGGWSIKDVIAHLWAWQTRSVARMEAARLDREPVFPDWPAALVPESDDGPPDEINAWIYETNRDRTWESVHRNWRKGFLHFVELGEAMPEKDLLEPGKYPWMDGYPLSLVLTGSYEHHHIDHLESLLDWLRHHGK